MPTMTRRRTRSSTGMVDKSAPPKPAAKGDDDSTTTSDKNIPISGGDKKRASANKNNMSGSGKKRKISGDIKLSGEGTTDTTTTNATTKGRKSTIAWSDKLEALKQYKAEHGHTNVPKSNTQYQGLGRFVNNQRQFYRKYQQGESSSLTAERIKSLEDVSTYSTYLLFFVYSIVSHSIFCTPFCIALSLVLSGR